MAGAEIISGFLFFSQDCAYNGDACTYFDMFLRQVLDNLRNSGVS